MKKDKKKTNSGSFENNLEDIVDYLDSELKTAQIKDYSCNGLQVQGSNTVKKAALVVDACMEAYRIAVKNECQLIVAHHGIIWNGLKSVTGSVYNHIRYLIQNNLNLYASHLPLDLHPQLGNNARLASIIGLKKLEPFGLYNGINIGFEGVLPRETKLDLIVQLLCRKLGGECTVLPFGKEIVKRIAIVSGGGGGELDEAIEKGIDCFITGETSHQNYHSALEAEINVIYAGHYYTEKPGVQAIGNILEEKFNIETEFIDVPTNF
ncbi:MAG TPA: Nif3-like dinuclear metal center hexameric protein [Chitinispirillaceae bacterium]|nr:Nif3-like dinuclear metal center hexameric protein [Chitinispirillaceae bacterium]